MQVSFSIMKNVLKKFLGSKREASRVPSDRNLRSNLIRALVLKSGFQLLRSSKNLKMFPSLIVLKKKKVVCVWRDEERREGLSNDCCCYADVDVIFDRRKELVLFDARSERQLR